MVITSALRSKDCEFESRLRDFDFICSFKMLLKEVQPDRSYVDCTLNKFKNTVYDLTALELDK